MQANQSALKNMNPINQDITGIYPIKANNQEFKKSLQNSIRITRMKRNIQKSIVSMMSIERNDIGMSSDRKRLRTNFDGKFPAQSAR